MKGIQPISKVVNGKLVCLVVGLLWYKNVQPVINFSKPSVVFHIENNFFVYFFQNFIKL